MGNDDHKIFNTLKTELKQSVLDFLNHEYIREKLGNQEDNPEFIMEMYELINEISVIVKKAINDKHPPADEIFTEEDAFFKVIEYNRKAKEAQKNGDRKKTKRFYEKKCILLKEFGEPLCIHSLGGGCRFVLVKLKNGTFHCPIEEYSLDELESLKVEEYYGIIE